MLFGFSIIISVVVAVVVVVIGNFHNAVVSINLSFVSFLVLFFA